ncbi:hypothetical protein Fleli_1413 [Bernardetia litoralis DSM 6794]|uniref:Uncharacterized protein n=2 Tax=Bernardetia litoralis TaxID=999 RepID=I4AIQ6_BERLS|nr:hypothetical protein Fleli_1413 [Bernardetia litoralis DSM 6794]
MGSAETRETRDYDPATSIEGTFLFPTSFGKIAVTNTSHSKLLDEVEIYRVELVYSKYPKTNNFQQIQQRKLNLARLNRLEKIAPQLFKSNIEWEFVAHIVNTAAHAKKLYHGFVVYYKMKESEKTIKEETLEVLENSNSEIPIPTFAYNDESEEATFIKEGKQKSNSTYQVFDRQDWKNVVVVCDWTASMYHFATPVLLWHNQKSSQNDTSSIQNFVFFNDGDDTPNKEKKIGSTGGIYATKTANVDEALQIMEKAKAAGTGGDFPENDIEALIYAQKNNPKAKSLVLIADNMASVRDIKLLEELTKSEIPVHILIARTEEIDLIRPEYWDIAIQTKGTIHTLKEDISLEEAIEHKKRLDELASLNKRELKKLERQEKRKIKRKKGRY